MPSSPEDSSGQFRNLYAHGTRRVVGGVDGLHAEEHCALTVVGVLRGRIRLAKTATVVVNGVLELGDVVSDGTLMVCGIVNGSTTGLDGAGVLAVAVGSVVNGQVLEPDGSLRTPPSDEAIDVGLESDDWCVWMVDGVSVVEGVLMVVEGRFQPISERLGGFAPGSHGPLSRPHTGPGSGREPSR